MCIRDPYKAGATQESEGIDKVTWNEHYKDEWGNMYIKADTSDIKTAPKPPPAK